MRYQIIWYLVGLMHAQGKKKIENFPGGFQQNHVVRTKFRIESRGNTDYSIALWQKKTVNGRYVITVPLQIKFDGSTKGVTLQERKKGRWVVNSRNRREIPLEVGETNIFVLRLKNCMGRDNGRSCELSLFLNGKNLKSFFTGNMQSILRWDIRKLMAVTNVKCECSTVSLIDMCTISKGNKDQARENKWKSLSKPECGRTWGLTTSQKRSLPNTLLNSVNTNSIKHHLDSCLAYRYGVEFGAMRIVGGVSAQPGMQPWLGSLRTSKENVRCTFVGEAHQAAASLISKCWMITAAHVFAENYNNDGRAFTVRLGDYYNRGGDGEKCGHRNDAFKTENDQYRSVENVHESTIKRVIKHPNYVEDNGGSPYDIALIELRDCVPEYNQFIQPVCLPVDPDQFDGVCGIVAGWGKTEAVQSSSHRPKELQVTSISILPDDSCLQDYKIRYQPGNAFCGGNSDDDAEHRDTCQGDSGGPFTVDGYSHQDLGGGPVAGNPPKDRKTRGILWGITSFGSASCDKKGVYTKVSSYMEWIYDELAEEPSFKNY